MMYWKAYSIVVTILGWITIYMYLHQEGNKQKKAASPYVVYVHPAKPEREKLQKKEEPASDQLDAPRLPMQVVAEKEECVLDQSLLVGRLVVNKTPPAHISEIEVDLKFVENGGKWKPNTCKSTKKVAVIIPYRDRYKNLMLLLRILHPLLRRQQLDYRVIVLEQWDSHPFNRAKLFNIAYKEVEKFSKYDCLVLHDADFLPEDDRNIYDCPTSPRHMAPSWEGYNYHPMGGKWMGGVLAISMKDMKDMNGWSNRFFGWGGEDDDFAYRLGRAKKQITRPIPLTVGRYAHANHKRVAWNNKRIERIAETKLKNFSLADDGISNVRYKFVDSKLEPLYTHVKVDMDMTPEDYKLTSMKNKDN